MDDGRSGRDGGGGSGGRKPTLNSIKRSCVRWFRVKRRGSESKECAGTGKNAAGARASTYTRTKPKPFESFIQPSSRPPKKDKTDRTLSDRPTTIKRRSKYISAMLQSIEGPCCLRAFGGLRPPHQVGLYERASAVVEHDVIVASASRYQPTDPGV